MFRVGKVRIFNKLLKEPARCGLLAALEKEESLNENNIEDLKKFVQTIIYNGKKDESYLETRIRLCRQQKENTSLSFPPHPDSLLQALKRAQLQTLVWCHGNMSQIKHFNPNLYGWKWDSHINSMAPLWFVGPQLPPALCKSDQKKKNPTSMDRESHMNGADEVSEVEKSEPRRKRRRSSKQKNDKGLPKPVNFAVDEIENE